MWWLLAACGGAGSPDDPGATALVDADRDGWGADDCDDADAAVHPAAAERCDGEDDDCDGLVDDDDPDLSDGQIGYLDADGDGAGRRGTATLACTLDGLAPTAGDCDDRDPAVHPGAPEACEDGVDQDCDGGDDACVTRAAARPAAPGARRFQPQSLQTAFVDPDGAPCTGAIAVSISDQALCWVDPGRRLQCAGQIWTRSFGAAGTDAGLADVSQVLVAPATNGLFYSYPTNGVCAVAGGVPACFGGDNSSGQFGTGTNRTTDDWAPWREGEDLQWLATGTADQYCGPDGAGDVWCVGDGFDDKARVVERGARAVWVDTFGQVHVDEPDVWRVSQGRASCTVGPDGLACPLGTFGRPGRVVDGGETGAFPPNDAAVWLEDDGTVWLAERSAQTGNLSTRQLATGRTALAVAYSRYADVVCAVVADGSLRCVGANEGGVLGDGGAALATFTEVLPDGSFDTSCQGDPTPEAIPVDRDGDGLSDEAEAAAGTDPLDRDSDDDGVIDSADAVPLDPGAGADGLLPPEVSYGFGCAMGPGGSTAGLLVAGLALGRRRRGPR